MMTRSRRPAVERRVDQAGLGRLQLAAVAASAFRIEEQVVLLQHLGDVRLQRDEVRRILRVAPDRDRAGDVAVKQAERTAEQVDARGDERRPHAVVVEHERLDQVVGMALVVRRVDDAVRARRVQDVVQVLGLALDLAEDRIERMLQRAVDRVPLRRPQFFEIGVDALARLLAALAVVAAEVLDDLFALEDGLGDVVQHGVRSDYSTAATLKAQRLKAQRAQDSDSDFRLEACRAPARSRPRTRASTPCRRGRACARGPPVSTAPSAHDAIGCVAFVEVPQHQDRRQQQRRRVRDVLARDVRRAAVHGFEHRDLRAEVRGADHAEAADQAGAQIRHDVAVQVRQHQHVELRRVASPAACTPRRRSSRRT